MRFFKISAPYKPRSPFQKKKYYIYGYSLVTEIPSIFTYINPGFYHYTKDIYIVDIDYDPQKGDAEFDKFLTLRNLTKKQLSNDKFI